MPSSSLALHALAFAKEYVALTEALLSQGVPEKEARAEARITALLLTYRDEKGKCLLCGGESA